MEDAKAIINKAIQINGECGRALVNQWRELRRNSWRSQIVMSNMVVNVNGVKMPKEYRLK